jgi:hypothetical protein
VDEAALDLRESAQGMRRAGFRRARHVEADLEGQLAWAGGDLGRAESLFRDALVACRGRDAELQVRLGATLLEQHRDGEAIAVLEAVGFEGSGGAYYAPTWLSVALARVDRPAEAARALDRARGSAQGHYQTRAVAVADGFLSLARARAARRNADEAGAKAERAAAGEALTVPVIGFEYRRLQEVLRRDVAAFDAVKPRGMRIVARYETVHLLRDGMAPVVLDGIGARIVSELAAMGAPVSWTVVAAEIWGPFRDEARARKKWDQALLRLRQRLAAANVRADLVRPDGHGNLELVLAPGDVLIDET